MSNLKHVYILGAGFSMPLGGPSFDRLISDLETSMIERFVGDSTHRTHILLRRMPTMVSAIWKRLGRSDNLNLEELLETLDYACQPSQFERASDIVQEINKSIGANFSPRELHDVCRTIRLRIAIATTVFLDWVPPESERWKPYKQWFADLSASDTIITFNYDGVVERTAALVQRSFFRSNEQTIAHLTSPGNNLPKLLKLHGSADWACDLSTNQLDNVHVRTPGRWMDYCDPRIQLLLGTPGLEKPKLSNGLFRSIWDEAAEAIKNAEVVSIVGYSIPATDNLAKALIENNIAAAKELRAINLVLGPSSRSPVAERAMEILIQTNAFNPFGNAVKLWQMYSQDFLPMYRPKNVNDIARVLSTKAKRFE